LAEKNITIDDIAKALNISKTTVSRAMSGKGRISEETRNRVLKYIEKYDYRPNSIAKSLAESKSHNIGFVIPKDYVITDLTFYQKCLWGIITVANENDYDVMVSTVSSDDLVSLQRIIENNKVDGIILGRTSSVNTIERYLRSKDVPFVTVGSSVDSSVLQVDNDHEGACCELTYKLLKKGVKNMALIGGDIGFIVNRNRYNGFRRAFDKADMMFHKERVYLGVSKTGEIEEAVDKCLQDGTECIICMDDGICSKVINKLNKEQIVVPDRMKIASFYNSNILSGNTVKITAVNFDENKLGEVSCKTLLDQINQADPIKKILLGYAIDIRESTGDISAAKNR